MARFRYIGKLAHRLTLGNVVSVDVAHGTVFDVPDRWAYALASRGTPVEPVGDDVPLGHQTEAPPAVHEEPAEHVEEPEGDAEPADVLEGAQSAPEGRESRRRRRRAG